MNVIKYAILLHYLDNMDINLFIFSGDFEHVQRQQQNDSTNSVPLSLRYVPKYNKACHTSNPNTTRHLNKCQSCGILGHCFI